MSIEEELKESQHFVDSFMPDKFVGTGWCQGCKQNYTLSVAKCLLEECQKVQLLLDGNLKTQCPCCSTPLSLNPKL